jgi:hypothetical protein
MDLMMKLLMKGYPIELEYMFGSFGIRCPNLIQGAANGNKEYYQQYIQRRREIDEREDDADAVEEAKFTLIAYPKEKDVLIGRGPPFLEFSGTVLWSRAMHAHLDRYMESDNSRFEKTCISMNVVKTVLDSGGRFLQRTPTGWKILDEVTAREKTAVAFRSRAKSATSSRASSSSRTNPFSPACGVTKRQRRDQTEEEAAIALN